ncbi:hypothetical protein OG874_07990 [Nocardia sp. NBC_00565]|uniref:esterase/lipase family protein n=1 Tax=Nocardia sp. NBC_00565 TaxID=2975993 RepID=UPI002E822903|nr:hypothetical protein [Nocardia sp. NBC_00565]WUC05081.1 hypothetical protein OG874_07990 [Nocardia sp. NBC_00565]
MTPQSRIKAPAAVAMIALVCLAPPQPSASAQAPATTPCQRPVVLVHDIGRDQREFDNLSAALHESGWCPFTFSYGATATTALLSTAAGLVALEEAAAELDRFVASLPDSASTPPAFVAHGSGSLVTQYFTQHFPRGRAVHQLVTIGPMWNGTNIAELGTLEQLSRNAGTYDAVLALESPVLDPFCAGCRQLIAGSTFLRTLHRDGVPTPGVSYINIISMSDALVSPPLSAEVPGMRSVILQDFEPSNKTDHFHLPDDPAVQQLTRGALGAPDPLTYHQEVSTADTTPSGR